MSEIVTGENPVCPHRPDALLLRDSTITDEALWAFRRATDVYFRRGLMPDHQSVFDMVGIEYEGKAIPENRFSTKTKKYELNFFMIDAGNERWLEYQPKDCYARVQTGPDGPWLTFADICKVGDKLTVLWCPNLYRNGYARYAKADHVRHNAETKKYDNNTWHEDEWQGLNVDALKLQLTRPSKGKASKRLTFLMDVDVTPSNTSRMIKNYKETGGYL